MKNIILSTLLLFSITTLLAQKSPNGYLGKKNFLGVEIGTSIRLFTFVDFEEEIALHKKMSFNYGINYERVIGRRVSLMGSVGYKSNRARYLNSYSINYLNRSYSIYPVDSDKLLGMSTLMVGFGLRVYTKAKAPLGHYFGFFGNLGMSTLDMEPNSYYARSNGSHNVPAALQVELNKEYSSSSIGYQIGWELGTKRIYNNAFYVDYNFNIGLATSGHSQVFNSVFVPDYEGDNSYSLEGFKSELDKIPGREFAHYGYCTMKITIGLVI